MKPGAVAASMSGGGTVAFSWEHEPGVSKQQSTGEGKKPAAMARRVEAVSRRTPATAKNVPAPAPAAVPARPHHRMRVPPPPGGPGTPAVLPPGKKNKKKKSRARDDPFLAAYLACTGDAAGRGGGTGKGTQKMLGWTGLGLGLGLGLRGGLGLSCKSSCGAVEECVVRLARISSELDED